MSGSDIPLESSGNCLLSAKGKGMYLSQQLTRGRHVVLRFFAILMTNPVISIMMNNTSDHSGNHPLLQYCYRLRSYV